MAAPTETSDLSTLATATLTEGNIQTTDLFGVWRGSAGSQAVYEITLENLLDYVEANASALQDQGDVLDDLNTLGAAASDGQIIVATGAGAFAYESGATARTSLGAAALGANTFTGNQDLDGNDITMGAGLLDMEGGKIDLDADGDTSITADTDDQIDIEIAGSDVASWDATGLDLKGNELKSHVSDVISVDTTSADVTLTAAAHSGNIILASGGATNQVIVPTTPGFTCIIIAGSAIDVEFNATTIDTNLASGDILSVLVEDATTIHATKILSANKETFS